MSPMNICETVHTVLILHVFLSLSSELFPPSSHSDFQVVPLILSCPFISPYHIIFISINPMFCNIYLWCNLSTVSFSCVFLSSILFYFLSNSILVCIYCPMWMFLLFVGQRNKLTWLVSIVMHCQSFPMICSWLFSFLSFSFFFFLFLSFTCPLLFPSTPGHLTKRIKHNQDTQNNKVDFSATNLVLVFKKSFHQITTV